MQRADEKRQRDVRIAKDKQAQKQYQVRNTVRAKWSSLPPLNTRDDHNYDLYGHDAEFDDDSDLQKAIKLSLLESNARESKEEDIVDDNDLDMAQALKNSMMNRKVLEDGEEFVLPKKSFPDAKKLRTEKRKALQKELKMLEEEEEEEKELLRYEREHQQRRFEEDEREMMRIENDRMIREMQDREYYESLALDQQKKNEEKMIEMKKREEEKNQEDLKLKLENELKQLRLNRMEKKNRLDEEPNKDDFGVIELVIKMPGKFH
eukprot:TRINITY_DN4011_c0_g1_i1.p1 TRINITY_DN4011_c0_g1~~TRINITY_DN4011_c0_g1_i1.p1  ORF type:complete len:263 (-),score=113.67 TRINITY_DN4011_c0_g1_i1:165-953(-)